MLNTSYLDSICLFNPLAYSVETYSLTIGYYHYNGILLSTVITIKLLITNSKLLRTELALVLCSLIAEISKEPNLIILTLYSYRY